MKNVLTFLKKIKKNNNTPWMHAHKDEYLTAKKEFEFLVQELITRISLWDSRMPHFAPKDCMFRFNRDIRFSDDKSPYKENFGAYFGYGGKKSDLPGYYVHVSPREVFVAAGVWHPEAETLVKLRRFILEEGSELEKILKDKKFKKIFGELSSEHTLVRPPKGFDPNHPYIDLVKFKSYTISASLTPADVLKPGFGKMVDKLFQEMKPLNTFLYSALSEKQKSNHFAHDR